MKTVIKLTALLLLVFNTNLAHSQFSEYDFENYDMSSIEALKKS